MMSLSSRRELVDSVRARYKNGSKSSKGKILDELVESCGYKRKYAICVLGEAPKDCSGKRTVRTRRAAYGADVGHALLRLWKVSRGLCGKRLVSALPELMSSLERHDELNLPPDLRSKLLKLSASTADRLLSKLRRSGGYGISTTRPGTLLKHQIPLHTFSDWKDSSPGFMEIDLVAHCDEIAAGNFIFTLTMTDVATGWTECQAIPNKGQLAVVAGLEAVMQRLPFRLRGVDCDNGTEFINVALKSFCEAHEITLTRGRPYKKNDQCHVEQKNGAVVRPLVGYARYEGEGAVNYINRLYQVHRAHLNYFSPSMKLVDKKRNGAKVVKTYDSPQTPYARLKAAGIWDEAQQQRMQNYYERLNPAHVGRRIDELEAGLKHHVVKNLIAIDFPAVRPTQCRLPKNLFGKKTK